MPNVCLRLPAKSFCRCTAAVNNLLRPSYYTREEAGWIACPANENITEGADYLEAKLLLRADAVECADKVEENGVYLQLARVEAHFQSTNDIELRELALKSRKGSQRFVFAWLFC